MKTSRLKGKVAFIIAVAVVLQVVEAHASIPEMHNGFIWLNDDHDGFSTESGETDVQDDLEPGVADYADLKITCRRDLEDFARLWIRFQPKLDQLPTGMKIGLKWKGATGAPKIKIYKAVESDGGRKYLDDDTVAGQQSSGDPANVLTIVVGNDPVAIDSSAFVSPTDGGSRAYLLFEGAGEGKGELVGVLLDQNNHEVNELGPGVWIELKPIKKMYERWTVGEGNGGAPEATAAISQARLPSGATAFQYGTDPGLSVANDPNGNAYIIFVHGWNLPPWERDAFAETMLKRLYWQGYKGKFGAFQWPTTYHSHDINAILDYDDGEYTAWRAAAPLETLLVALHGHYGTGVQVLAHSMGNVVTGEALRLAAYANAGQLVNTYVATQAAVPGHCYDPTLTGNDLLSFGFLGFYGPTTPNIYNNWLEGNSAAVGAKANFYNVNDFALSSTHWQLDQIFKPDTRVNSKYDYVGTNIDVVQDLFVKQTLSGVVPLHFGDVLNVQDGYEIMAYAAEPRSKALGGVTAVAGFAPQNLSEPGLWPGDSPGHSYEQHKWHSAQFRFTNVDQRAYWHALLGQFQLLPNQ